MSFASMRGDNQDRFDEAIPTRDAMPTIFSAETKVASLSRLLSQHRGLAEEIRKSAEEIRKSAEEIRKSAEEIRKSAEEQLLELQTDPLINPYIEREKALIKADRVEAENKALQTRLQILEKETEKLRRQIDVLSPAKKRRR